MEKSRDFLPVSIFSQLMRVSIQHAHKLMRECKAPHHKEFFLNQPRYKVPTDRDQAEKKLKEKIFYHEQEKKYHEQEKKELEKNLNLLIRYRNGENISWDNIRIKPKKTRIK